MSVGGLYVDCRLVPSTGQQVEFWVSFQYAAVHVRGTVAYAKAGQGFGLEFEPLADEARERIHACLIEAKRRESR